MYETVIRGLGRSAWLLMLAVAACGAPSGTPTDGSADPPGPDLAGDGRGPSPDRPLDLAGDPGPLDGPEGGGPDSSRDMLAGPPLRVLFVGNSYTYVNDLPSTVKAIVEATTGRAAEVEAVTQGGGTLADHWETTGARQRIEEGDFDAVVLQGQSLETVFDPTGFQDYAARFSGLLADTATPGVWFATWARRDVEASPEMLWPAIEEQYAIAAARNGDALARVGAAWEIALLALPGVELLQSDRSHPTTAGTLLAGCVIARALTGTDPRLPEATPFDLERSVAERLCGIADGGVPCDPQQSLCDGSCLPWDTATCGGCGVACGPEEPCRLGVCGCDAGLVACDQRCVTLGTVENCGSCGDACGRGQECTGGGCTCPDSAALDIFSSFGELTALEPACATRDDAGSEACNAAAHAFCAGTGCFSSGFLPAGHAPRPEAVMCLPADVRETTFTVLDGHAAGCDGVAARAGQTCATASHRFCVAAGALSGFGPVTSEGEVARVACIASGELVRVSLTDLSGYISRCVPDAGSCSSAAWNFCEARGHTAGFGPVEVVGDDRDVICVD